MKGSIKKMIAGLLISTYLNLAGCTSQAIVSKEALFAKCDRGTVGTLTIGTKNSRITLDEATCSINNDTLIVAGISDSLHQAIRYTTALDDIRYIELEEYDSGKTLGCIIGASAVALGVFVLIAANSLGDSYVDGCKVEGCNISE